MSMGTAQGRSMWRAFLTRPANLLGVLVLLAFLVVALFGSALYPVDPWAMAGAPFVPPLADTRFPLGTDTLGRDVAAGIVHGARVSLVVGATSAAIAVSVGVAIGALSGYFRGWLDRSLMRITEFFQTIPNFIFTLVLVAVMQPSVASSVLAIGIVTWPPVARLVRGEFVALGRREFVLAARALGESDTRIMFAQILPNILSPVVAIATLMVGAAILLESSISFLGQGDANQMSWGYMIGAGRTSIRNAWWPSVLPGVALATVLLALNLVGQGLSSAMRPRNGNTGGAR